MKLTKLRILEATLVPPTLVVLLNGVLMMTTEGERRCFERLDLATPGAFCAVNLIDPFFLVPLIIIHVVTLFPLALWARSTRARRLAVMVATVAMGACMAIDVAPHTVLVTLPSLTHPPVFS